MADVWHLFIKSEAGKTRVIRGWCDQFGHWEDCEGTRYHEGPGVLPQGEKMEKGKPVKWTLLDKSRTPEKRGK